MRAPQPPWKSTTKLSALFSTSVLALCLGCSNTKDGPEEIPLACDDAEPAPSNAPTFEVGKEGGDLWKPIATSDALPVVRGGQGGMHIDTALRFFYDTEEKVRVFAKVTDPSGDLIGENAGTFRTCAGKWTIKRDFRIFMYRFERDALINLDANLPEGAAPSITLEHMELYDPTKPTP